MALYRGKKKDYWVTYALDASTGRILSGTVGGRGTHDLQRVWGRVKDIPMSFCATDGWRAYTSIIPKAQHLVTKALTHWIESSNMRIRHYLARFHRKTLCYSKSLDMVIHSLNLLFGETLFT